MLFWLLCLAYILASIDAPVIYVILAIIGYAWYLINKK